MIQDNGVMSVESEKAPDVGGESSAGDDLVDAFRMQRPVEFHGIEDDGKWKP